MKMPKRSQIKKIFRSLNEQFGIEIKKINFPIFIRGSRIFLTSKLINEINLERLRIEKTGLYIANMDKYGIRLTIEGSQIFGPLAHKNVIEMDEKEVEEWIRGNNLENKKGRGYFIVKHKNDYMGSGLISKEKLLNYLPKSRTVKGPR